MLLCLNTTDLESSKFQYNLTSKYYLIWPNLVENQLSFTWNHDFNMTVNINQSSTEKSIFLSKSSKKKLPWKVHQMQNFDYCQLKRGIIPASVCKGLISEKHCTLKSFFALFSTVYKKVLNFPIIANFPGWPLPKPVGNYRVTTVQAILQW